MRHLAPRATDYLLVAPPVIRASPFVVAGVAPGVLGPQLVVGGTLTRRRVAV